MNLILSLILAIGLSTSATSHAQEADLCANAKAKEEATKLRKEVVDELKEGEKGLSELVSSSGVQTCNPTSFGEAASAEGGLSGGTPPRPLVCGAILTFSDIDNEHKVAQWLQKHSKLDLLNLCVSLNIAHEGEE